MLSRVGPVLAPKHTRFGTLGGVDMAQVSSLVDRIAVPGVRKTIGPGHHAMLHYGVAFTFFSLAAKYWSASAGVDACHH